MASLSLEYFKSYKAFIYDCNKKHTMMQERMCGRVKLERSNEIKKMQLGKNDVKVNNECSNLPGGRTVKTWSSASGGLNGGAQR
jgi:hypothetical protein